MLPSVAVLKSTRTVGPPDLDRMNKEFSTAPRQAASTYVLTVHILIAHVRLTSSQQVSGCMQNEGLHTVALGDALSVLARSP